MYYVLINFKYKGVYMLLVFFSLPISYVKKVRNIT